MAIYKSSNCSPQLEEIDFTQNNTFSCVVNTSGEPAKAYKLKIMSEDGSEIYYEPSTPTNLTIPIPNKGILNIKKSTSQKWIFFQFQFEILFVILYLPAL